MSSQAKTKSNSQTNANVPAPAGARLGKGRRRRNKRRTSGGQAVSAPVSVAREVRGNTPRVALQGTGNIRVRHREFVCDVVAKSVFETTSVNVNPGLATCFSWMSGLARLYETYTFNSLKFEYIPMVATSTDGMFMMSMDYDASEVAPADKAKLMSAKDAVRSSIWQPASLTCSGGDLHKFAAQRYNRTYALAANLDIKTYDVGCLHFAAITGSTRTVGELYVTYDVTFQTPEPFVETPFLDSMKLLGRTEVSKTALLGQDPAIVAGAEIGVTPVAHDPDDPDACGLNFEAPGQYKIDLDLHGTGVPADPRLTATYPADFTFNWVTWIVNAAATATVMSFLVNVKKAGFLKLKVPDAWTSVTESTLRLSPYLNTLV